LAATLLYQFGADPVAARQNTVEVRSTVNVGAAKPGALLPNDMQVLSRSTALVRVVVDYTPRHSFEGAVLGNERLLLELPEDGKSDLLPLMVRVFTSTAAVVIVAFCVVSCLVMLPFQPEGRSSMLSGCAPP